MVFIKTDNRNCFSLHFLLGLDLVELDFSWNNTLMSCPIDFCCKRNKSPRCLRGSHLETVKNMHSVSSLCEKQRRFPCPPISGPCRHSVLCCWVLLLAQSHVYLWREYLIGRHKALPAVISPLVTVLSLRLSPCPSRGTQWLPTEAKAILPLEIFRLIALAPRNQKTRTQILILPSNVQTKDAAGTNKIRARTDVT